MSDYSSLTLSELKQLCSDREIPDHGTRKRIISRLIDYDSVDDNLTTEDNGEVNDDSVDHEVTVKDVSSAASTSACG